MCVHLKFEMNKIQRHILPKYFKSGVYASFQRQLNMYNFKHLTSGGDAGAYYHELFLRGKPDLCEGIQRMRIKGT